MGKFDNVRKTIRRNKRRIHTMYFIIFVLAALVFQLYYQNLRSNTRDEIKKEMKSEIKLVRGIYENDSKSKVAKIKELESLNFQYNMYLDSLPFGKPVDKLIILSEYGWRTDPFNKTRNFHYGIDLHTVYKQPIIASGHGEVVRSKWHNGFGFCVEIQHPLGYTSLYGHLSKILVRKGQDIAKGDTIGLAGSTGRSTGVHLHYEIHQNDSRIDPYKYLQYFNIEMPDTLITIDYRKDTLIIDSIR